MSCCTWCAFLPTQCVKRLNFDPFAFKIGEQTDQFGSDLSLSSSNKTKKKDMRFQVNHTFKDKLICRAVSFFSSIATCRLITPVASSQIRSPFGGRAQKTFSLRWHVMIIGKGHHLQVLLGRATGKRIVWLIRLILLLKCPGRQV